MEGKIDSLDGGFVDGTGWENDFSQHLKETSSIGGGFKFLYIFSSSWRKDPIRLYNIFSNGLETTT